MKVYYFNDTYEPQSVYIDSFHGTPVNLQPATGSFFEVSLKENQYVFIKVWETGNIFLGGIDHFKMELEDDKS
jgi:hypothetical protein